MPLIIPGNVASATAAVTYSVANSCRFNDGDSAYMNRDLVTPTNADRWTYSLWVKRSNLGASQVLLSGGTANDQVDFILFRGTEDQLEWQMYHGTDTAKYKTNRVFRDPSAWYHLVFTYDSGNATAGDRMKIYVNGVEETSFGTEVNVDADTDSKINAANQHDIGYDSKGGVGSAYFDGYMAEVVFCDGQAYAASDFGEFDEDSPTIWKPKKVSGLTFGNNGFYLDFEASDNLGNDANGGTDFAEVNLAATDQSTDTPTLNYPTFNSAQPALSNTSISEGNLTAASNASASTQVPFATTIPVATGKWYAEFKMTAESTSSGSIPYIGVLGAANFVSELDNAYFIGGVNLDGVGYGASGVVYSNGSELDSSEASFTDGDIVGVAADITNKKIYFSNNGTYINSQDPAAGSNSYTIPTTSEGFYIFAASLFGASGTWEANFGSPSFSISSGNADGDGYGNFEYAVPSGFYALNSKNLAEYG